MLTVLHQPGRLTARTASLAVTAIAMTLGGCALPRSGPSEKEFLRADEAQSIDLVTPTLQDALQTRDTTPGVFGPEWQGTGSVSDVIGVGDVLAVTIFERDGLNLFPAGSDGGSRIQGLIVDSSGNIQIPYAGAVKVGGLTPNQARNSVMGRLRRVSFSPDVVVAVTERKSRSVSIQGDVTRPGPIVLEPGTRRLSALLGAAAPTPTNIEFATVTVQRDGRSQTVRLADIYDNPQNDIALLNGDVVIVRAAPGTVNVLGAAGVQGRVKISKRNFSVLDAVGDARGLNDALANPAAVYVMRLSDPTVAAGQAPKVYHFDFRSPAQLAIAGQYMLRDGDAVMISNAPFAQSQKVLSILNGALNSARGAVTVVP